MPVSINIPYVRGIHKQPYPGISPLRPELSQAGRTVLVVGGSTGIGFAIARAFIQASASHVIVTGRRQAVLTESVARLETETGGSGTVITGLVSDMADLRDAEKLWDGFKRDGVVVDVLVLNGGAAGEAKPILEASLESTWRVFETNHLVNVSSSAIHNFTEPGPIPTYGLTKNAGTLLIQQIAMDTDPSDTQVVSFHPGSVLSESARNLGLDETTLDWDDGEYIPDCAVYLCTGR
ncbi:hypothetical protein N0V88_007015 [Collariella sp. IMI 366227]|nr:hypothetical protein N0V88_007015 [Collariella sp. IMI 366227]